VKPSARDLARKVLLRVGQGAYASLALSAELSRARLNDADASLATELVYGALKRRLRLDRALAALAPRGIDGIDAQVLDVLRLAALQILFLRIPDHAAVDDAVEAIKRLRSPRLAGFANALLRRLAREGEPALPDPADVAARLEAEHSTPRWLVDDLVGRLGAEQAGAVMEAWNRPAPTWLRSNFARTTREALAAAIAAERPRAEAGYPPPPLTPAAPAALSFQRAGDLSATRPFAAGWFTAQDLGAQLVGHLVDPRPGERLLDACAGVGGKATHLFELTGGAAHIDAADLSARKLQLGADTAHRLGADAIRFIEADLTSSSAALGDDYDRVLCDAPCSGLGVLRRHPELKWRRTAAEVTALATLQARLLDALCRRVRPGGLLVYSVCTFTDEEGRRQTEDFLARHPAFSIEPPPATLSSLLCPDGAIRTWPHRDDADAFYAVRLRRR